MANEIYHRSNWGNAVNDIYWADVYEKYSATNKMYIRSDYYENSNETDKLMADIYPKPSILLTPTAYDNGSLHSVKPVQSFGSELSVNGDFATDSDWTKGTNWSIANGKATVTNSTTSSIFQDILNVSKKYKVTFEITEITSGSLRIGIGQNFSDYFTQVGTYTYYGKIFLDTLLRINPSSGTNASIDYVSVKEVIDADFDFTRGSSATRVNSQGLIEDVTGTNTPRIDYLGGTGSILLEPASTNRTTNSEQPSTWHSSNGMTITADATTSPDGTTNASLVVINASSGSRYARNSTNFPSGSGTQTVTLSCFLKYYNNQWVRLKSNFFTGSAANGKSSFFDIQNGVLGTVDADHTAKIEDYGSGWYRCSITFDIDKDQDSNGYIVIEFSPSDDTNTFAAIGQGAYAFGSQSEELSYMTSYIPTTSSYGSRNADVCNNAGSSDLINSTEGVLYAEISALSDGGSDRYISLSDGSSSNIVSINLNTISNRINLRIASNGVNIFIDADAQNQTELNKVAIKYKSNDCSFWINGVKINSNTTISHPLNLSKISFNVGDGGFPFYGNVKTVAVFKEALDNDQLERLTGEGYETFNLLAQANNYTII